MTDTVRVPREPTEAMLANGREALLPLVRLDSYGPLIGLWRDMLAASPQGEGSSAEAHPPQPDALPGDLREKIAGIIVRKVLQEDYDDLVEGYLDEILMAADEIILLPAYQAVAQTYYDNLARAALTTGEATTPNAGERG